MTREPEKELEFALLLASYNGDSRLETEDWNMNLFEDGSVVGTLYVRPARNEKFLTLDIKSNSNDRFEARFKPFSVIQEETEIKDFGESVGADTERRLLMFLLLNPKFIERLKVETKKNLVKKLRNL